MYIDQAGMIARYGEAALIQLTDRSDPPLGAVDPVVLAEALADAAELIHGYARTGGYQVPLAPVPDAVKQLQAIIAYYQLHGTAMDVPEKLAKDYDRALGQLKDIAKGLFKLEAAGAESPAAEGGVAVLFDAPARRFDRQGMEGL